MKTYEVYYTPKGITKWKGETIAASSEVEAISKLSQKLNLSRQEFNVKYDVEIRKITV